VHDSSAVSSAANNVIKKSTDFAFRCQFVAALEDACNYYALSSHTATGMVSVIPYRRKNSALQGVYLIQRYILQGISVLTFLTFEPCKISLDSPFNVVVITISTYGVVTN
jgi:hypothetical protein